MRISLLLALFLSSFFTLFAQQEDKPFKQYLAVKYKVSDEFLAATPKKVVVDYNDAVYILTNQGVFKEFPDNVVAKDNSYASIASKNPIDITTREASGELYYLYQDGFLSNAFAGRIGVSFDKSKSYEMFAVNAAGEVLLLADDYATLYDGNVKKNDFTTPNKFTKLYAFNGTFYAHTKSAIYKLGAKSWRKIYSGSGIASLTFDGKQIYVGTDKGYLSIDPAGKSIQKLESALPVVNISNLAISPDKGLWFATAQGAFTKETDRYRYFASKRWLNRDEVIDMDIDSKGNVFLLTSDGLNQINAASMTLADKATFFQDRIRKHFLRYGFVCAPRLTTPYDFSSEHIIDHDNDGLWTSFYLGSQAFRYATTKEKEAKRYAWESFAPFERIIDINPIVGFPARTFEREGFKVSDLERWRMSQEEGWEWKGTTSSDEYIAYLFVASVMDQFVAESKEEKQRVANFIDAIMTHIITNDYKFIDHDGKPTTWGRWDPEYVEMYPKHVYDRKLNSTHLITGLQLAYKLTGKEIFKTEMYKMIDEYGYLENMMASLKEMRADSIPYMEYTMGDSWNHSDDEMAFLTYWPMYHYALNDDLKKKYAWIIDEHWEVELPERNAAWNLLTYGTTGKISTEDVFWHLREFGLDQMEYVVKNSHRKDLKLLAPNFRGQTTEVLLTPGERRTHRHNANPFRLDGGSPGTSILAGDEYLLPYWMARYLGVLK